MIKLANQTKMILRNRKVSAISLLESVLFSNIDPSKVSLNDLAIYHHINFGISLTRQAISKRFNNHAIDFVKLFLKHLLKIKLLENGVEFSNSRFNRILIKDSTCNQLPENLREFYPGSGGSGSKAAVRIQFEYDLKNLNILDLDVSSFNHQDLNNAKKTLGNIQENDLVLRDLGYTCIETLQGIDGRNAWYISRLNPVVSAYEMNTNELIDFAEIEKSMRRNNTSILEKAVLLGDKKYRTRLVIELVPEQVKEERVRKAVKEAKKKGRVLSKEKKARFGVNLLLTNTNASILSASELRRIYSIRWQIELIFKAWKQNSQFHKIKKMNKNRYEFLLYAKLIWIILNWTLYQLMDIECYRKSRRRISVLKFFKSIGQYIEQIKSIMRGNKARINDLLESLMELSKKHLLHDDRKERINWINVQII